MILSKEQIKELNKKKLTDHQNEFETLQNKLIKSKVNTQEIVKKIEGFQVAIPSWALGAGGTRFGRFSYGGEPASLEQKIADIGILNGLTRSAGAISLHIPWDIPDDIEAIKELAASHDIVFDAVNSNTFQDQTNAKESYKYGSLANISPAVRDQAIQHNIEVINIGNKLDQRV